MTNRSGYEFQHTSKILLEKSRRSEVLYNGYELTEPIAKGGEGEVYRSHPVSEFDDIPEVAIKIHEDRERYSNIGRQARIAQEVSDHPNIPEVYSYGEAKIVDSTNSKLARFVLGTTRQAMVMQYIDGPNLRDYTKQGLSTDEAVLIGTRLASALDHIHNKGYAHLDVKGQNVIMESSTAPLLTDFGIAREIGERDDGNGTVVIMPPEQRKYGPRTASMDVYAWGIEMHRLLTGKHPDRDKTTQRLLVSTKDTLSQQFNIHPKQIPAQLRLIIPLIENCLDPNPGNRPESMTTIQRELTTRYQKGIELEKFVPTENAFEGTPPIRQSRISDEEAQRRQHESRRKLVSTADDITRIVPPPRPQPEPQPTRPPYEKTKVLRQYTMKMPPADRLLIMAKGAVDAIQNKYENWQESHEAAKVARAEEERAAAIIRRAKEEKEWERREKERVEFEAAQTAEKHQRKQQKSQRKAEKREVKARQKLEEVESKRIDKVIKQNHHLGALITRLSEEHEEQFFTRVMKKAENRFSPIKVEKLDILLSEDSSYASFKWIAENAPEFMELAKEAVKEQLHKQKLEQRTKRKQQKSQRKESKRIDKIVEQGDLIESLVKTLSYDYQQRFYFRLASKAVSKLPYDELREIEKGDFSLQHIAQSTPGFIQFANEALTEIMRKQREDQRNRKKAKKSADREERSSKAARLRANERTYKHKLKRERHEERRSQPSRRLVLKSALFTAGVTAAANYEYIPQPEKLSNLEESKRLVFDSLQDLMAPVGDNIGWNVETVGVLIEHDIKSAKQFIRSRQDNPDALTNISHSLVDIAPHDPNYALTTSAALINQHLSDRLKSRYNLPAQIESKIGAALAKDFPEITEQIMLKFKERDFGYKIMELGLNPKSYRKLDTLLNYYPSQYQPWLVKSLAPILSESQPDAIISRLQNGRIKSDSYIDALGDLMDNSENIRVTPQYALFKELTPYKPEYVKEKILQLEEAGHFDAACRLAINFIPSDSTVTHEVLDRHTTQYPQRPAAKEAVYRMQLALATSEAKDIAQYRPDDEVYSKWFDFSRQPNNQTLQRIALDAFHSLSKEKQHQTGNNISMSLIYNQLHSHR